MQFFEFLSLLVSWKRTQGVSQFNQKLRRGGIDEIADFVNGFAHCFCKFLYIRTGRSQNLGITGRSGLCINSGAFESRSQSHCCGE